MAQFNQARSEEDTVIHWFDEQEIDPIVVDVTQNNDEENGPIIELVKKNIGPPRNYGLTIEEKEEEAKKEQAEQEAKASIQRAIKSKRELQERMKRRKNIEVFSTKKYQLTEFPLQIWKIFNNQNLSKVGIFQKMVRL